MRVVLDAEAVNALLDPEHASRRQVRDALRAATNTGRDVAIATVTLAELYRGAGRNQALDAMLSRQKREIVLRDTDRSLARLVGALLTSAGLGSEHLADAHVAAVALEQGGFVLTGDPGDLERLLAGAPHITVVALTDSRT